jgi:hypothetical protein
VSLEGTMMFAMFRTMISFFRLFGFTASATQSANPISQC